MGIGSEEQLAESGFASAFCKYAKIENVILKLFKIYSLDKQDDVEQEEINWLADAIMKYGQDQKYHQIQFILGLTLYTKVFFDKGSALLIKRRFNVLNNQTIVEWLEKALQADSDDKWSCLISYIFVNILQTISYSKNKIENFEFFYDNKLPLTGQFYLC